MKKDELTDKDILEYYNKIQAFAQIEIERVYKTFKTLIWTISLVFTVGVAVAAIVIGRSVADVKEKYERSVEGQFIEIQKNINNQIDSTRKIVNARIEDEFEKENITLLVEHTAKERVDKVADSIITKLVAQKIQPIENNIAKLEKNTNEKLERLLFDYYLLQIDNDSRDAFTKILNYSLDNSYPFKKEAKAKIEEKLIELNKQLKIGYLGSMYKLGKIDGLNVEEIVSKYINQYRESERIIFLSQFFKLDIGFEKNIQVLFAILKIETSLERSYLISKKLVNNLKLDIPPYKFEKILEYKY